MTIAGFTPLNTQNCTLNESRVDLWQFSLKQELHNANELLHPDELERSLRFHFEKHRRQFCTARGMMRLILSRYLNTAPQRLKFSYNPQGKPEVLNSQRLHFNISHSNDLALLAVGKKMPVGVDIEYYSERPYEGIARNLFSAQELCGFLKTPASMKPAVFFHVWSQKEAFIKACGLGLAYPTQEFTVPTDIPTKQLVHDPLHNLIWQMRSFMPEVACSGALCIHPTIREVRHGIVHVEHDARLEF